MHKRINGSSWSALSVPNHRYQCNVILCGIPYGTTLVRAISHFLTASNRHVTSQHCTGPSDFGWLGCVDERTERGSSSETDRYRSGEPSRGGRVVYICWLDASAACWILYRRNLVFRKIYRRILQRRFYACCCSFVGFWKDALHKSSITKWLSILAAQGWVGHK